MANLSTVKGSITFDFSSKNWEQIRYFIKRYTFFVGANLDYWTELHLEKQLSVQNKDNKTFSFRFNAVGRGSYANNLEWLTTGLSPNHIKLRKLLRKQTGIVINIDWEEYETGNMDFTTGEYELTITENGLDVTNFSYDLQELTQAQFIESGFGDVNDWDDMFS